MNSIGVSVSEQPQLPFCGREFRLSKHEAKGLIGDDIKYFKPKDLLGVLGPIGNWHPAHEGFQSSARGMVLTDDEW